MWLSRGWAWASRKLERKLWLYTLLVLLLASHFSSGQPVEDRFLELPRTSAFQSRWYAWAPQHALPGGILGLQEVCEGNSYIDRFTVSMGSAVVNGKSSRAHWLSGMLSIQGRCSNGKQLGRYGLEGDDASAQLRLKNIQVDFPEGFGYLHGTGLGVLEGFMDIGEVTDAEGADGWLRACPDGSKVDGYQVIVGGLVFQIRPRCSCVNCGDAKIVPPPEKREMHRSTIPIRGIGSLWDPTKVYTLRVVLTALVPGGWMPAASGTLETALLLQLHAQHDEHREGLQLHVHGVEVVYGAARRGTGARHLLGLPDGQATEVGVNINVTGFALQRTANALTDISHSGDLQEYMRKQGTDVKGLNITGLQLLAQDTLLAPLPAPFVAPTAAPVPAPSDGGGLDLATIGKGIGIAAAGLIAISLCLTVTILEMIKLNRQAKEEEQQKKARREAEVRLGKLRDSHRSLHTAQETDEFWMYDELKTRVQPPQQQSSRDPARKFAKGGLRGSSGSPAVKDKDSDKMLTPSRRRELQEDTSRVSTMSRESTYSMEFSYHNSGFSAETGSLPSLMAHNDWEIAPMDIEIMRREDGSPWELGAGAFGKVYKGLWNEVQDVAVKMVVGQSAEQQARFLREIAILKDCRNVHVVQFLGACMHPGCTMLITELMAANAQDLIHGGHLPWREKGKQVALDAARGLAYLHRKRIAWLDCKASNVLLTKEGTAKVADVGLAHVVHASHIAELDALGTFAYAAPELINGDKCNEKADIWSFAVLLHELITAEIPRRGKLRDLIVPDDCTYEEKQLVKDCLQNEPDERPSAKDIVNRLAGSAARRQRLTTRSSSLSGVGSISGQLLADRGLKELMSGSPMSMSALREQDRLSRERLNSRERLSQTLSDTSKQKSEVRIPIPPPS